MEHRLENRSDNTKAEAKQLRCNIFREKRPKNSAISCIAHKLSRSTKGVGVQVTPNSRATMTVVPWSLVQSLNLDLNIDDDNYDLLTASGYRMTVLGTVIIYLEPEGADTRPVLGIVTDDHGDQEIFYAMET